MARYLYTIISKILNYLTKLRTKGGEWPPINFVNLVLVNYKQLKKGGLR